MGKILRYIAGSNNIDDLGEGIISVPFLPERGQIGKIYRNRQDNKYYLWNEGESKYDLLSEVTEDKEVNLGQDFKIYYSPIKNRFGKVMADRYYILDSVNNKFVKLQTQLQAVTEVSDVDKDRRVSPRPGFAPVEFPYSFILDPDVFYDLRIWYYNPDSNDAVILNSRSGTWNDGIYSGRISFVTEPLSLVFNPNVIIPGDELNIELDHTYEFNIVRGVLLMTDITNQELLDKSQYGFYDTFESEQGTIFGVRNIGETEENPIGQYFSWGELQTQRFYDLQHYPFYVNNEFITYTYDGANILTVNHDVAFNTRTADTPCDWYMPTVEDLEELSQHPVLFGTTKINGQDVQTVSFLNEETNEKLTIPCVGYYTENGLQGFGSEVLLWSRNLNTEDETSGTAKALRVSATYSTIAEIVDVPRYYGCLIKPIVQ